MMNQSTFKPVSLVFLAPAAALLAVLFAVPVCYAIYLGFTNLQLIGPRAVNYSFTGLQNVRTLLADDVFVGSLVQTIVFVVASGAIGSTVLGLAMALLMQKASPRLGKSISALAILAWNLPPITIAVIWYAATTSGGTFPRLLGDAGQDVLYTYPMLVVSLANVWSLAGLSMLMFAAALRSIPTDMIEAALLENANAWQRLTRLTLPMLKPTILMSSLLMTLLTFGNFTLVYLMTGGGPDNQTNILPIYSYLQGFKFHRLGYSALLGDVIVVLSSALGLAFVLLARQYRPGQLRKGKIKAIAV
ncbi:sugar ABC transporter permease [Paraburkholderia sp. RP-4-7]|jgi:multiple sugar transport system permease protein|uniref:Sugar ABC transporter permease n=1 Tax=Paraburkholderia polaris TaxID=2728848 RepID=A0A848IGF8_9BURK|nr:sugar ABC transporter permease [Paraburkholderia polaris]NML99034.1 sugar ABC transporter permease [Paraburkholderia polaris]